MQPINQFLIFEFGAKVRAVSTLPESITLNLVIGPMIALQTALRLLVNGDPVRLDYSMASIKDALSSVEALMQLEYYGQDGKFDINKDWTQQLSPWAIGSVKSSLVRLEHNLAAEFEKTATYLVAKTTSFDTATLIETATDTLTPEVKGELSEMAVFDYTQAGRCLGFGLYTAAGFHVARATEAVMLSYCEVFLGKFDDDAKHTWGQLLHALEKCKKDPCPDKSTLAILEQIKNVDRNELMHPRKRLDLTEATRLFYLATSSIIAMAMEMRAKRGKAQQGQLFDAKTPLLEKPAEAAE